MTVDLQCSVATGCRFVQLLLIMYSCCYVCLLLFLSCAEVLLILAHITVIVYCYCVPLLLCITVVVVFRCYCVL